MIEKITNVYNKKLFYNRSLKITTFAIIISLAFLSINSIVSRNMNTSLYIDSEEFIKFDKEQRRFFEGISNDRYIFEEMINFYKEEGGSEYGIEAYKDESLFKYLSLDYIQDNYVVTPGNKPTAIVFDQLVDYTHDGFKYTSDYSAITKVVTIDNNGLVTEYDYASIKDIDPFLDIRFEPYIAQAGSFGHGTHVAGIIHQIAPEIDIISVAHKGPSSNVFTFVNAFLDWLLALDIEGMKIVNISEAWEDHIPKEQREGILDGKFLQLLEKGDFFFSVAAGNSEFVEDNDWNLCYPASLANNWERNFDLPFVDYLIDGVQHQDTGPIYANGFVSVSPVYDDLPVPGIRDPYYVFDNDNDGDLKIMAPGFNILSTYPTKNPFKPTEINSAIMSGSSMAAPVISGIALLMAQHYRSSYGIEEKLLEKSIYDSRVPFDSSIEVERVERLQKYGLGMVNPLELLGFGNIDSDDDGLTDIEELYGYHTDAGIDDSDYDGLDDDEEINTYGTNPNQYDSDGDGVSDGEEIIGFYYPTNPEADGNGKIYTDPLENDCDDDFIPDGYEINIIGTDPLLIDSDNDGISDVDEWYGRVVDGVWVASGGGGPGGHGRLYEDDTILRTDPLDSDTDNDGLLDGYEIFTYETNPIDDDTDNDGWKDGFEINTSGTNPKKLDTDNDGINDVTEYNWWRNSYGLSISSAYTKIKDSDSDNDGLNDGYEKSHGFNPLDNDMDNDGLLDGLEVYTYHTDPQDSDSDNDGYDDLNEIINDSDPNDSSDYPGGGGIILW
ncbi:MAG: S8 family serine peptidase [Candidatus Heimdallarchaeota archaeon]